ncbi:MAG: FtsX-like permease family protein [Myxococcaceae bacterium]|nr:FtsX-like permease family protein [Myxococcaceae bacterium]
MGQLRVLWQIALRNLFASKINVIIGFIILGGTFLVVLGGSMLDSMDAAMSRSIIGSVAGHIQVYSSQSKEALALFGNMGGEAEISALDDFSKVKKTLETVPNVERVVPMGINAALVQSGNTIDLTLGELRGVLNHLRDEGESPERREKAESLKAHVRQQVEVLKADIAKARLISNATAEDAEDAEVVERVSSEAFWKEFESRPFDQMEYLENRLAPMVSDADLLYLRYAGTDLKAFQKNFDRMRIVDGAPVPDGERGFLFAKLFYEETLKLKSARRLDKIKEARDIKSKRIATDDELKRWVKENSTQTREFLLQLDGIKTRELVARLQKHLGSKETELSALLGSFFTTTDENFDARYAFFYEQVAPLLQLYRVRVGDTLSIQAFTKTGYMQSVNLKVYGTFTFEGLEKSDMAGGLNLMDLVSFRELYGYLTAEKKAEIAELKKKSGSREIAREGAEDALFGEDAKVVEASATPGLIDDSASFGDTAQALRNKELASRVYSQDEIDQGVVLSAAVMLKDPTRIQETIAEIHAAAERDKVPLKAVSWQEASGLIGQFVLMAKLILYFAVFVIFIVALVIINNAMMMATLRRVHEIGTMRAIGAQRAFVLSLVLMETVVLGLLFGGLGMLFGSGLVGWLHSVGIPAGNDALLFFFSGPRLFPSLTVGNLVAAFVIVMLVSAISTLYPALIATRVSPLRAMQAEE